MIRFDLNSAKLGMSHFGTLERWRKRSTRCGTPRRRITTVCAFEISGTPTGQAGRATTWN